MNQHPNSPYRVPEEMFLEHLTTAKWELVDAQCCTECGFLTRDGRRMVDHLWTHVTYACEMRTPASQEGRCYGCGWLGPADGATVDDLEVTHREHRLHSAREAVRRG